MHDHTRLLRVIEQLQEKSEREMRHSTVLAEHAKASLKEASQTLASMKELLVVLQKDMEGGNKAPKTVVARVEKLADRKDGRQQELDLELTRFEQD